MAAVGAVRLASRLLYRRAYLTDPSKRAVGFALGIASTFLPLLAALVGAPFRTPA